MFNDLCETHAGEMPDWAKGTAYQRLIILHRVLEGKLYEPLGIPFHQETDGQGNYIPITRRRPSGQYNLPRTTSLKITRKMFAGRQKPSWRSDDESVIAKADLLAREGFFDQHVMRAAFWGMAGASAMTFSFLKDGDKTVRAVFATHPAHECLPVFDSLGELYSLRINKCVLGSDLINIGMTVSTEGPIEPNDKYWHIIEFTRDHYVEYVPPPVGEYAPTRRDTWGVLRVDKKRSSRHGLGFVPAHWFCDMTLGPLPFGGCFFEKAMDMSILLDYTISQHVRGLWYGAAPQLQIKGELKGQKAGPNGMLTSNPANVLHFDTTKTSPGGTIEGGDAKMVETSGAGFSETREAIEVIRKFWLEQVQSSRKDPDRMRTAGMSGAAMENMDEDLVDLIQDFRVSFGEMGMLVCMKKALRAATKFGHPAGSLSESQIGSLTLQWPQPFPPGSHEILELVQAMTLALGTPDVPATPGGGEGGGGGKPAVPGTPALLELDEAQAVIRTVLNLPLLNKEPSRQQTPRNED